MWLGVPPRNGYQKDMPSKEIGLHAQNIITILGSIINIIGWKVYDHLMSTEMLNLINNKMFICAPIPVLYRPTSKRWFMKIFQVTMKQDPFDAMWEYM
jgi:hypothetical protein